MKKNKMNDTKTATEKDIKTSLNLGTKFQQMQQKFLGETCDYPNIDIDLDDIYKVKVDSGSNSVKTLTSKFDFQETKEGEEDKIDLKRVVKEQKKMISNLKDQVEVKDRRIQELEAKVKHLLSNNPAANLNISIKHQIGNSLA